MLKGYRKEDFMEQALQFLWGKWSQMGLAGVIPGRDDSVMDPEALLLFTLDFGRYDPRLFDEVLDWLVLNGRWINVRRMRTGIEAYSHAKRGVLAAVCSLLSDKTNDNKWTLLLKHLEGNPVSEREPLFFSKDGRELPYSDHPNETFLKHGLLRNDFELRQMSSEIPVDSGANLIFKLRSLFGLSSRAEIIAYLLTNERGYPSSIARDILYSQKSVYDALTEMSLSGLVESQSVGREKYFSLENPGKWWEVLGIGRERPPGWVNWLPLFDNISRIYHTLGEQDFEQKPPLIRSTLIKPMFLEVVRILREAGNKNISIDESALSKDAFDEVFESEMRRIWEALTGMDFDAKPEVKISASDLNALIDSNAPEGETLDYKGDCYAERKGNLEIARDISAFANKNGGRIIIGVSENGESLVKTPIENPTVESLRIRQVSQSSIEPRIKGLEIQVVRTAEDGNKGFVVVFVPESKNRPHMVTSDGKQEFWVRDGDTRARMTHQQIQELMIEREGRNEVSFPVQEETLEKRIERTREYLAERTERIAFEVGNNYAISLCCVPILPIARKMQNAREITKFQNNSELKELLKHPPDDRYGGWVVGRTDTVNSMSESLIAEVKIETRDNSRLELSMNGTLEFLLQQAPDADNIFESFVRSDYGPKDKKLLYPWAICEYPFSFFMLAKRIYDYMVINDDILVQARLWNIKGLGLGRYTNMFGYNSDKMRGCYERKFDKNQHLSLEPVLFGRDDFSGKNVSKFVTEFFYSSFGYDKPGMIDDEGNLRLNVVV